jgi:hypothetical protein
MSHILTLASDFIERMSNPAYGIRENEEYSLRLGALLSSDGFDRMLIDEIKEITNPAALTPHGWLWLLNWARAREVRLNEKLLLQLSESFSSVFMQVAVIDIGTAHADWQSKNSVTSLKEFKHSWLSALLNRCVDVHEEKETKYHHIDTRRSETVLVALMQVGRDITLDAASTLLNHRWFGQKQLVKFFWSICDELDTETHDIWISRLRPPYSSSETSED